MRLCWWRWARGAPFPTPTRLCSGHREIPSSGPAVVLGQAPVREGGEGRAGGVQLCRGHVCITDFPYLCLGDVTRSRKTITVPLRSSAWPATCLYYAAATMILSCCISHDVGYPLRRSWEYTFLTRLSPTRHSPGKHSPEKHSPGRLSSTKHPPFGYL